MRSRKQGFTDMLFRRMLETIENRQKDRSMPTLFRFLFIIATVAAMAYAFMWALVIFVEPRPREISTTVFPSQTAPKTP
ncbi:hypothetical protein BJF95_01650 [Rhizobium oryziradicis]|uniref:Uncharacterized protein n=2 Tax=Rhizobium oryziradicis TaxID=1867956 RepID=A0A1Q8ZM47_9HYPH|nr:hypothetical protein BJF95_01650 [Rhizobium oryziradicis]